MQLVANPTLVPVVELAPSQFGTLELPTGPWSDQVALAYWRGCLAQSGLVNLNPFADGSWLVRLADLAGPATLTTVLRNALADTDREDVEPYALRGGFALCDNGEPTFLPQCCGDLSNLDQWQNAATHRGTDAAVIWIGHPWIEARYQHPHLLLAMAPESTATGCQASHLVEPAALAAAVNRARVEVAEFCSAVVTPELARMGIALPQATAATLLGISSHP